jgi:hypothetical protein
MNMEPIPGFPGYYATRDGRIFSDRTGELVEKKQQVDEEGYHFVNLRTGVGRKTVKMVPVHKCVLLAFVGPKPTEEHECRHLDRNPANNHVDNLCWGTRMENHADAVRHGTAVHLRWKEDPTTHPKHKLTNVQAEAIRRLRADGWTTTALAKEFGVTQSYVSAICNGRTRNPASRSQVLNPDGG